MAHQARVTSVVESEKQKSKQQQKGSKKQDIDNSDMLSSLKDLALEDVDYSDMHSSFQNLALQETLKEEYLEKVKKALFDKYGDKAKDFDLSLIE